MGRSSAAGVSPGAALASSTSRPATPAIRTRSTVRSRSGLTARSTSRTDGVPGWRSSRRGDGSFASSVASGTERASFSSRSIWSSTARATSTSLTNSVRPCRSCSPPARRGIRPLSRPEACRRRDSQAQGHACRRLMVARRTILLLLLPVIAAGCRGASTTGDKAGGTPSDGTVVLRLASTPSSLNDVPLVDAFVRRVWQLSHGALRIKPVNLWGNYEPGAEAQVVRSVASGNVDLGWAGSRVFDSMGLSSFQALSAPMLIDSYPLEEAVLHGPMAPEMLDGLKGLGVTPVGILADVLRHPIGV